MLTKVSVVPPPGAFWPSLDIPVQAASANGAMAEKVDGLEPIAAEITTTPFNLQDGDFYVGSRVPKRNIVLHLLLGAPGLTVAQVRRNLYGYFMPKMNVLLQLEFSDRTPLQIEGWVESFEGDRWSNDPDAAVSIICPKPNFVDLDQKTITGFSKLNSDPPLAEEFSDVLNEGDRMVGFELFISNDTEADFDGDIHIERYIETSEGSGVYFSTQKLWLEGVSLPGNMTNYVYANTYQGKKKIQLINPSPNPDEVDSILGKRTKDSSWPVLWNALNKFRVVTTGTTGWAGNSLTWVLKYQYEYGGV